MNCGPRYGSTSGARRQTMRFGILMLGMTTMLFGAYGIALNDAHPQSLADTRGTPLILEKNEGEHRVRRPRDTPVPTGPSSRGAYRTPRLSRLEMVLTRPASQSRS